MQLQEQICADLITLVRHFNGREYLGTLGPETFFFADLGMSSIDAVVLAEMLEERYKQKFPFSLFLAKLKEKKVRDLQLKELAEFLGEHLMVDK